ncbi:MAG: potassium/proton antiporter [Syntrophales bacterium]|jgi:cell volume regulation protein A|nr:potassium/proton antiporter [Syntrophales bacterium]MCK9527925.1 potassium/proton antiporter [Syntrophales bacterium]MDX9921899.1 potassium/proton antiporter [Syntrophales bacterium]
MDVVYVVVPILLIAIALAAVWLDRWSVPVILIALGAGILFGSDVLRLWHFDDIGLTNRIANLALVFILFHGGFTTRRANFQAVALPAGGLATWGVVLTALATFGVLYGVFNWSLHKALLLAAIISSTDAAAIFSILRRQPLPSKLSSTVEIESAANDPMAILLTVAVIDGITTTHTAWHMPVLLFIWKFAAGPFCGWFLAKAALWLFNRLKSPDRGYYYVLSLGIILLIYGLTEMIHASGMLAVFVAGYLMGNRPFVYKQGVTNFSSAISTIANVGMFALMGLQVFPHQWGAIWLDGILLFLVLTLISRPFAVLLGTTGMRLGWRNKTFIAWAGLRGSVPIVLATYPAAAGLAIGQEVFNLVFFAVLLSIAIQGSTLGWVARLLNLMCPLRPKPLFDLELVTMAESDFDLMVVDLPDPHGAIGCAIADLQLPAGSVIVLITRDKDIVVPKGSTNLQGWDRVTVLAHAKDHETIRSVLVGAFSAAVPQSDTGGGAACDVL